MDGDGMGDRRKERKKQGLAELRGAAFRVNRGFSRHLIPGYYIKSLRRRSDQDGRCQV